MAAGQSGARWLAQYQREFGATSDSQEPQDSGSSSQAEIMPPRYPLPWLMGPRALSLWISVLDEYGLLPPRERW
jgi:hypothetical protein